MDDIDAIVQSVAPQLIKGQGIVLKVQIQDLIANKCNESRIDELKQVQQCGHNTQAVQFRIDTLKGQL